MRPWKNSLLILVAALLSFAQSDPSVAVLTPAVKRVGARLACLCGSCKNSVADCAMLHCHYSGPAREKIAQMLAQGMSDDRIVDSFVKEQGLRALVVPPAEGFNVMAWVMPFVVIALGLWAIWLFIRRFRKPSTVPELDPAVLERYRDRIEKDLSKLE
jgi:cytochrome c-type biogenesis protein CcmH